MDILKRNLAPIPTTAWELIDQEAKEILKLKLHGRKVTDFVGPKCLKLASVNTGRSQRIETNAVEGVNYSIRNTLPLIELKIPFQLKISEFEALARGAKDVDTAPLIQAAKNIARAENNIIFYGLENIVSGMVTHSTHPSLNISGDRTQIVPKLITGIKQLIEAGVSGPYKLLLDANFYAEIYETADQGYPLIKKIKDLIGDNIVFVTEPGFRALLVSARGDDYQLIVGQDLSIGYNYHTSEKIEFFIFESLTFRVNTPEAAIVLN